MKDEGLFPAKCCGNRFSLRTMLSIIGMKGCSEHIIKAREYEAKNKLYCPDPRCSEFLGSKDETVEVCTSCFGKICKDCSAQAHRGACSTVETSQFIDLATQKGWRQCNACRRFVELNGGCYHIVSFHLELHMKD